MITDDNQHSRTPDKCLTNSACCSYARPSNLGIAIILPSSALITPVLPNPFVEPTVITAVVNVPVKKKLTVSLLRAALA